MKSYKLKKESYNRYESLLCDRCKKYIALQTMKLRSKDLLRPKRTAKKSLSWLCDSCKAKLMGAYKK